MIYCQTDLDKPERVKLLPGQLFIYTHRSPDKLSENEDSLAVIPTGKKNAVFAVADGLGGLPSGSVASQIAISSIENALNNINDSEQLREIILNSFEAANRNILEKGAGSATTLAVVELQGDEVRTYHVGDSKVLICGQRGKVKVSTVSHSPVEYAVEAGLLDENEAVLHDERHLVSNVVGDQNMTITLGSTTRLHKYDTLLIASDGLFDNFFIEEIIEIIRKGSLEKAAEKLVGAANQRMLSENNQEPGHPDDMSFIIYRLN